jgi:hypothetical protein
MRTMIHVLAATAAALLVAACGGGSDVCFYGPGKEGACATDNTAETLTIQLDKTSITNSGTDTVVAIATAATAGGETVTGVAVSFAVDSGATFTTSGTETDAEGTVTATVNIGSDKSNRTITITATSGTLTATATFTVTGSTLTSTASPAVVVPSSTGNNVIFVLKDAAGSAMANQAISIAAGAAGTANGFTDSNGAYTFTYTAPATAGLVSVVANAGGVEKVQDVQVQASGSIPPAVGTAKSATVAANPSVVAPNVDATSNNRAEVRALFLDASNNPIPNMRVRFSVNNAYGTFATGDNIVYSDANGVAATGFIPSARTSPTNGVIITACYANVDFAACGSGGVTPITTTLTVAAEPLSITIGTDRKIVIDDLTYQQRFVVTASDIAGRPKANVDITPSIDLQYYFKGRYVYVGGSWVSSCTDPTVCSTILQPPIGCQNEDTERTGFYQMTEDINENGKLDPSRADVLISAEGSTKTDENGQVVLRISYAKNLGSWLQYQILVSAGVAGTEGRKTWTDVLGVPIGDVKTEGAPAFVVSPYGVVTRSAVPSINFPGTPPRGAVPACQNAD